MGGRAETDPGVVLTSADAGRTWSVATQPAPARLHDVAFADGMRCVAVGLASTIERSTDGGATWARDSAASTLAGAATLLGAVSRTRDADSASARTSVVLATHDGGATFVLHDLGDEHPRAVAFDGTEFQAFGDAGAAWRARRDTFVRTVAPEDGRFNALAFAADGGAVLAGLSGRSWWRANDEAEWIPIGLDASAAWCDFARGRGGPSGWGARAQRTARSGHRPT